MILLTIIGILAFIIVIGFSIQQIFRFGFARLWDDTKCIILIYAYVVVLGCISAAALYIIRALIFGY